MKTKVIVMCAVAVAIPFVSAAHFEPTRSWSMARGTHRPEILIDGKDVYLVVVEHVGKVRHRAYRYRYPNLDRPVISFDVSRTTERYGYPADHRAVIVDGELVVVYQSNVMKQGASRRGRQGPAEDGAQSQSLLLARFTLDGKQILRRAIVDRATDFRRDNFPDFCILWRKGRLLVQTGSRSRRMKIREVDREAKVLAVHELDTGPGTGREAIGNSFLVDGEKLFLVSAAGPRSRGGLTVTPLGENFKAGDPVEIGRTRRFDRHFPTSNLVADGYVLLGHITGNRRILDYDPHVLVLDADREVVRDFEVGRKGFAHVHPTLVKIDDSLLVAWSRRSERRGRGSMSAPQVVIQEYQIKWRSQPGQKRPPAGPKDLQSHQTWMIRSTDGGRTFNRGGRLLFDKTSVPSAICLPKGRIVLAFVDAVAHGLDIATSDDGGKTWDRRDAEIEGDVARTSVDPCLVLLDDGSIRLYYYGGFDQGRANQKGKHEIRSALSVDGGRTWVRESEVRYAAEKITDPDVFRLTDGRWVMHLSKGPRLEVAVSKDGLSFEYHGELNFGGSISGTIRLPDGRFRCYLTSRDGIRSILSEDGLHWEKEDGIRMSGADPSPVYDEKTGDIILYHKRFARTR